MSPIQRLVRDAAQLDVALAEADAARLLHLLDELARWNRTYNLTAIRQREAMLTHHLLDSLSVHAQLRGERIADVGTGAGFPGLPLALVNPTKHFTLIDSNGKKIRFAAHAVRELGLGNVDLEHARIETLRPARPFETIVARAFASLSDILRLTASSCADGTRVVAMKGRWPHEEIAALPPDWRLGASRELTVPGIDEARCVIVLEKVGG